MTHRLVDDRPAEAVREPADLAGLEGLRQRLGDVFPSRPRDTIPAALRAVLGVPASPDDPDVEVVDEWTVDGVEGTTLRWSVGFGPRTEGWLLRPAGEHAPLPGLLALHCHGGRRFFGKEKIADRRAPVPPSVAAFRQECYSGRAIANDFARAGYAVLVHDALSWGSRRLPIEQMSWRARRIAELEIAEQRRRGGRPDEEACYDIHAAANEDPLAKTLGLLGTSWGGVVACEDVVAAAILSGHPRTRPGGVSVVGFSGGGARAAMLGALSPDLRAVGIVSMMSTFAANLDGHVQTHTWMLHNPGIGRVAEWPDIAAARAPRPLFIGYTARDALFSGEGMREADRVVARHYAEVGAAEAYRSEWADAPHSFPLAMQQSFVGWLDQVTA